jgi:hypothetical protein
MRNELLPENLDNFRERFASCGDGGIHQVEFELFSTQRHINPYAATIVVGAQDLEQEGDNNWVNLTFEIVDITKMFLRKERDYDFSIIYDLQIEFFDDEIYLNFFPSIGRPTGPASFENEEGRKRFLIVGKKCFWSVSSYKERELREW